MHIPSTSLVIPSIAVLVLAVIQPEATHPTDLVGIASMISASIGVIGFVLTVVRHKKTTTKVNEVQQAASYVEGFDALIKHLQEEVDDLRQSHIAEHEKWMEEREVLQRTIEKLKFDLTQAMADGADLRGQLAELRGQIKGFLNKQQYEEFKKHLFPS